ncbi:MAG TPA: hypothetical protein VMV27_08025 [Candidatus Binataceae bacterium]|nr:hypothetical protein [Candidatus Binataceae bacterium]
MASRFTKLLIAPLGALAFMASGCIVISSSSISNSTKAGAGNAVTAQASDFGILRLAVPNGLTQTANANLLTQCTSGKFTDATTELSMRDFIIVQQYQISVSAVCQ